MKKFDDSDIKNINSNIIHSKEELIKVQKKFIIILSGLMLIIFFFVLVFVYHDNIKNFFKPKSTVKDEVEKEPVIKPNEQPKKLYELADGTISKDNEELTDLFKIFYYDYYDYLLTDTTQLYRNTFDKITPSGQLYFVSKTKDFYERINRDKVYVNREELCQNPIAIQKQDIETILKKRFNVSQINHTSFWTIYKYNNSYISHMYFNYQDGAYVGTCRDYPINKTNAIATNILSSAEKKDGKIYMYIKTIFENKDGVYKDLGFKELITNIYDEEKADSYYANASTYCLEFALNDDNTYYFDKITLIK